MSPSETGSGSGRAALGAGRTAPDAASGVVVEDARAPASCRMTWQGH